ncbi:C-type cyclin [Neofusicoccum parvum]|uniref:C-type cyclin n=1 Tax=Neofusicoccum parvum TaxID=310453 RepID=A0ACB5RTN7_9PEZI|nr:C-type cyclin [Neofusicoccum parvum]
MSSQYEPAAGAEPVLPWSIALLSQRDLALVVPINFVTQPAVSLTEACFSSNRYEDSAARRCLSNLLAVGFKRITVDLYWDVGRGLWSLCPVEIPESASSDDDATVSIISSTADATLSSVLMSTAGLEPRQTAALSSASFSSATQSPSTTGSALGSAALASPTQAEGSGVIQGSQYNCSSSLNVSTISSLIADYLDTTADTINASLIYLTFNIHAAASNSTSAVSASAPAASQLPSANTTLSNVLSADLAPYLYTPTHLRNDRTNLNDTWFGYDVAADPSLKPVLPYIQTSRNADDVMSTENGWPSESVVEFGPDHLRLLASFGRIDVQMAAYDAGADNSILFPEDAAFEPYQAISLSSIWSWADNEPRNITNEVDNANYMRCATMRASTHGRWALTDCTERHHAACRVGDAPYQWRISDPKDSYTDSNLICPQGSSFDTPRTALENRYLFAALQTLANENPDDFDGDTTVWLNFNSLDVADCWVVGVSTNCPYDLAANQDENRLVIIPTVAAVIVFVCAVLTVFVKCAGNRRSSRKIRRRRMQEGWEYEGVPS